MDEVRFVFRCFFAAALVLVISQLKTKTGTIETDLQGALVNSKTASFVNQVADGGAKAVRNFVGYVKDTYNANRSDVKNDLSELKDEAIEQAADLKETAERKIDSVHSQVHAKVQKTKPSTGSIEGEEIIEEIE